MKKRTRKNNIRIIFYALLLSTVLILSACDSGGETTQTQAIDQTSTEQETDSTTESATVFTLEALADYDGQDGRPAYIAVDGIVYDVSDIPQWADGMHAGRFEAGKDYSEEIRTESPHGTRMLERAVEVGVLAD